VEASNNSIIELQQFWLRNQSELVKTVQRVGQQSEEIKSLKKQYTILLHKKQRTEGKELQRFFSWLSDYNFIPVVYKKIASSLTLPNTVGIRS
jgi:uncharacterized protein (DUF4213/DUF364 family)